MSSKLTELTESSPSALPPSVLCGSGVFSQLSSPSMVSSGHFDPSQTYDGYREFEVLDPACTDCLAKETMPSYQVNFVQVRRHLWSRKDGPYGQEFPILEEPTPDATSGFSQLTGSRQRDVARWTNVGGPIPIGGRPIHYSSEIPISRTNTDGVVKVVKKLRRIVDSPTDPDAEGSDELDGEEVEVVPHSVGHPSSNSSSQPLSNTRFQSQVIPSTPRTFQPMLASIPTTLPPPSPTTSHNQACLESRSKTLTSSAIQRLTHNHLPPTPTCGQIQQKKRWIVPFAVSCHSSFSKKRTLAYPGYQRRSQRG
ncbi:hypothetical protein O181_120406 [Austropuccinia psidii MF-1]|uniref:Uncharacterized protein n=1 Tax=Austropuccinia psidii MF-1 TaxID=1389203 RepID=A0A9Q3KID2_9BASI|nr:hypothetical protein [Austropuccinia psidii MF-1]